MSREILDSLGPPERLVIATRIQRELSDQLALQSDHTDALIGNEELDLEPLVGSAEADVMELDATAAQ
jgi:hypothetical protein